MPRAPTAEENAAAAQFEWNKTLADYGFVLMEHENYFFVSGCAVLALIALVSITLAFRQRSPMPPASVAESTAEESIAVPDEAVPAEGISATEKESSPPVDEAPVVSAQPRTPPQLVYIAIGLLMLTLLAVAVMGYFLFAPVGTGLSPNGDRDSDRISAWMYDSTETGEPSEKPVLLALNVYSNNVQYSEGSGSYTKAGKWHDDGFWIENQNGSGETEAARLVDPLDIEVHVGAFIPGRPDKPVLYKALGTVAEQQAIAAKYPSPVTYPPPKGVITYDMTEYDLRMLPWRPDYLSPVGEHAYSRGTLYHYHSDDPKVPPLEVTLMNRRVYQVSGGYP